MHAVLWIVARYLICARKFVMQIHQWQALVPIFAAALAQAMHKDAAQHWIKFVNVQFVRVFVRSVVGARTLEVPNTSSHEVLENQAGRT